MRAKRGNLVAASVSLLLLAALLMLPEPAHACLCASSGSPREAMAEADSVFFGRVTSLTVHSRRDGSISSADPVTVEFDVIRVWKGPLRETLTVETERMGISCGYEFKESRRYIVYTWDGNRTGRCTRTAPAWLATRDFAALGVGQDPGLPGAPDGKPPQTPTSGGPGCNAPASPDGNRTDFATLGLLAGAVILGARTKRRL